MIVQHQRIKDGDFVEHRITIVSMGKPKVPDVNRELQWFGTSLGLFNLRDRDSSCFRVFIELLKAAKLRNPLTSDELAARTELTRGTVVHHLNKLIDAGIVTSLRGKYMLRADTLKGLVEELQRDMETAFDNLKEISGRIDGKLGL